jgi:hypothetical protein
VVKDITIKMKVGIDIVRPECAVPLDAPSENLRTIAETVKTLSANKRPNVTR